MPRVKSESSFVFIENTHKEIASSTKQNYKTALNNLTKFSMEEHEKNNDKPIIRTKTDLLENPEFVIELVRNVVQTKRNKCVSLAAIFYIIGRQEDENHPYVKEFRKTYYTDKYLASLEEKKKLSSDSVE